MALALSPEEAMPRGRDFGGCMRLCWMHVPGWSLGVKVTQGQDRDREAN